MKRDLSEHSEGYCTVQPSSTGLIMLVLPEEKKNKEYCVLNS